MKRMLVLLLVLLCLIGAVGCGEKKQEGPVPYQITDLQKLAESGAFSEELEEIDGETAFLLYRLGDQGLTPEDVTGCAVLYSTGATCEEGAVLVLAGEEQAEKAKLALENHLNSQIEANRDYRPAELAKLENPLLDVRGNTVLLVVADHAEAARQAVGLR